MFQNTRVRFRPVALLLAGLLLAGASSSVTAQDTSPTVERTPGAADPAPAHPELAGVFEEFGGRAGLDALMEEFMSVLLADPRMRPFFEKVEHDRVKRQLAEQFCAILGGGCVYTGRDMIAAHAAHGIDRADFNALVEDLQIAMSKRGIPFRAQNKLLALLAPMHREVINR
ncbi:MAG: group 1 truncated hemoglobin [Lysobacter sp.]|nr:group 1 truncated hemoglobin [Lysobacter sp.]